MAILGFHFSSPYKESLHSGNKTATVMMEENYFRVGQKVQVYLSEEPNLLNGREEKRIGEAEIKKVSVKKVGEINEEEARKCGSKSLKDLKEDLKKWYDAGEDSTVTFVEFDLKLLD